MCGKPWEKLAFGEVVKDFEKGKSMNSKGVENKLFGIPPGTAVSVLQMELPTGRRAVLVTPADMTSREIDRLCIELHELGANTLTPLAFEAVALELADPASAKREPWEKL